MCNLLNGRDWGWEKLGLVMVDRFVLSSVQLSGSVMSNSWRPHESQHARPPCPSPTPGVHSDSRSLSQYWNFSFSIIPSKEIPGLVFRMYWLDLLAVQGTLKSLLQHHSSKASILRRSAFFTVQLSHPS